MSAISTGGMQYLTPKYQASNAKSDIKWVMCIFRLFLSAPNPKNRAVNIPPKIKRIALDTKSNQSKSPFEKNVNVAEYSLVFDSRSKIPTPHTKAPKTATDFFLLHFFSAIIYAVVGSKIDIADVIEAKARAIKNKTARILPNMPKL